MAQFRQSGHHYFSSSSSSSSSNGASSDQAHISIGIRASPFVSSSSYSSSSSTTTTTTQQPKQLKPGRVRQFGARSDKSRFSSFTALASVLFLVLLVTLFAYYFLSLDYQEINARDVKGDGRKNDINSFSNVTRKDTFKVLGFGKGKVMHGRDSRYWDKDDRRRDEDYNEDDVEHSREYGMGQFSGGVSSGKKKMGNGMGKMYGGERTKILNWRGVGLYDEDGRKELKMYEAEYEASMKNLGHSGEKGIGNQLQNEEDGREENEVVDSDEYDDGIDLLDTHGEEDGNSEHDKRIPHVEGGQESSDLLYAGSKNHDIVKVTKEKSVSLMEKHFSLKSRISDNVGISSRTVGSVPASKSRSDSKRKTKRRKFSGSSCEMKFLNVTQIVEPLESKKFARFSLQYVDVEEKPNSPENWEPRFAGHQSLQEREESFLAYDKKIHCGFVKGPEGSSSTGFDLKEDDAKYLSSCHIAVISCIFGNSDRLRSPVSKMVSRFSRKNVCFVMFVDELTLGTLTSENHVPDREGFIGLWKVVVVKNLPYADMRRVGKVPKLLPHRLFPSARYSIWLDSKLRLQIDPYLALEYFLWRKGYEYAISNHYDRHCVWEEVAQNKRLNKYNHTVIDQQFEVYQADGLKRFNASDPHKLLPSYVPEGSLIVRAHTPMSNLFSCLWFNEVERFTPRDQLSFAYTFTKLRTMNPGKPFHLNMFKDCERRAIAKLFRHRSEEKRNISSQETAE